MWDKEAGLPRETMVPETFMDKPLRLHCPIIQKPLVVVGMVTFVTSLSQYLAVHRRYLTDTQP